MPAGERWIGDDAAVLSDPGAPWQLLAVDSVVAGVHADLSLVSLADLGWKALAANLSDLAAMGAEPWRCVVSVAGAGGADLDAVYEGLGEAAALYECPVVGGDLVAAPALVVTVAVTGTCDGPPVGRDGARPGHGIWVTGALGASAAGLRVLRGGGGNGGGGGGGGDDPGLGALIAAHRRPLPRLAEGRAARLAGATAMVDVSDGFASDLWHVARASGVGLELDLLPVAPGATRAEAAGGGEDYELAFCAPDAERVVEAFAGLRRPVLVGRCTDRPGTAELLGEPFPPLGWEHSL